MDLYALQRRNRSVGDADLEKRIETLLEGACPKHTGLVARRESASESLVELSETYAKAGWKRVQVDLLERAAAFSAVAAVRWRAARPKPK